MCFIMVYEGQFTQITKKHIASQHNKSSHVVLVLNICLWNFIETKVTVILFLLLKVLKYHIIIFEKFINMNVSC